MAGRSPADQVLKWAIPNPQSRDPAENAQPLKPGQPSWRRQPKRCWRQ